MFLNPRFPKESVIQRQVIEGVHAVVELDMRAHSYGKIPLQVFDRSTGADKARFDQYTDLDPPIAAEIVVRTKNQAQAPPPQYAPPTYAGAYPPYGGAPPPHQAQPLGYGQLPPAAAPAPAPNAGVNPADWAGMVGRLDNTQLQRLLAGLQPQAGAAPSQAPRGNSAAGAANGQVDLQALLGNMKGVPGPGQPQVAGQPYPGYGAPAYGQAMPPANGGAAAPSTNAQVQNIMAQLARYRQ
jgi:hypothetical protein